MFYKKGVVKGDLRPKLHLCFYPYMPYIFVNFMEKEPCTRFHGLLVRIHEVIELQSFEFSVSDFVTANVQNISPLIFYRSSHWRYSVK